MRARAFTRFGPVNLRNARHAEDPRPLDEHSPCEAARTHSRAYLHHLMRADEMLGAMLLSEINLAYYQELMQGMRAAIGAGAFSDFKATTLDGETVRLSDYAGKKNVLLIFGSATCPMTARSIRGPRRMGSSCTER